MGNPLFVWLDAMGVIFESADDARDLLVPFAHARGCEMPAEAIVDVYRACSLGRFSSAELWRTLGVAGDPALLDDAHLAAHRLMPGIVGFIRAARRAGVRVGCASNDVREWAALLRSRHGLDALVSPWVTSGDLHARKPDRAVYDHLFALTDVGARGCVVVDDREANLDVARQLGFTTVRFGSPSARHPSVASAAELGTLLLGQSA